MQDYTIGENYTLPSLGKVYNVPVNPEIKIRSMTTEEEMKRVVSVDQPYKNMSEIIDDCLLESPGISAYDMCIGDYQFLLHKLRVVTYGPEYQVVNTCTYCGHENEDVINLDELPVFTYTEEFESYKEFTLPRSGNRIRLKVQTPRMFDKVQERYKDFKRKTKGNVQADPSLIYTIVELIETIDGREPDYGKLDNWVRKLPMADVNEIIQRAERMNESIGVGTKLVCDCQLCGLTFETGLRATNEFFRPAIHIE